MIGKRDKFRGNSEKQPLTAISVSGIMCVFVTGLMELIHKAAFRETLGRSLYMTEKRVGSFTAEHVNSLTSHYRDDLPHLCTQYF